MRKSPKLRLWAVAGVLAAAGWAAGQDGNAPPSLPAPRTPVAQAPTTTAPVVGEGSFTPGGGGSDPDSPGAAGGGSKASGGDPTTTGRAQEVGNPRLGQLSLKTVYDFDNDGFK